MEQNPKPEPPEGDEKKTDKKRRKRRSFLSSWLAKVGQDGGEGHSEELESDEGVEKPNNSFIKSLRGLFRGHVETEKVEDLAAADSIEEEGALSPFTEETSKHAEDTLSVNPENPDSLTPEEEPVKPEEEQDDVNLGVLKIHHDEVVEPPAILPLNEIEPQDYPGDIEMESPHQTIDSEAALPFAQPAPEAAPPLPAEVVERPERRHREPLAAATLLGLGAEYIGRKRQGKAQNRRLEKLERQIDKQPEQPLTIKRETIVEQPAKTVEDDPEPRYEQKPKASDQSPEKTERPSKEKLPNRLEIADVPRDAREKVAQEVAKKVEEYERLHKAPTSVLKEMLTAAEVNAPVERIYERRQEVRDEPSKTNIQGAASVGAILQGMAQPPAGASSQVPGRFGVSPAEQSEQLYKQAAQRGFWGAIVILIFALMVYLIG